MSSWWQRRTLRFRLAVWYALGGTVLLTGFSAALYVFVADRLAEPLDRQLQRDLAEVYRRLRLTEDRRVFWDRVEVPANPMWTTDYPWFELWDEGGLLVRRCWPFTDEQVALVPSAPYRGRETFAVYNVAPDLRLRVLSVPIKRPGGPDWMIRVMRMHEPAAEVMAALGVIIIVALPVVVALLVVGGYVITRRWLQPLDRMVAEAKRISAADLGRRLPVANPHDEVGQLAVVFNVTLDRLESSFAALDRFVADASHELRTPLTTLRSVGEVGLRRGRTEEEYREIIGSMLEEAQRLQLLIQRLLELASAEGGAADVQRTEIQVDEFVSACVAELGVIAEHKSQTLAIDAEPCVTRTDGVILRQALQNLVDNAMKYSPAGSTIRVSVRAEGAHILVAVTDQGPGISEENRERLTERFFRPDRGRGRSSGGFGLGLSITKAYMHVLGGTLEFEPRAPTGSVFRLKLPKH